jgi:hypothetical protein
MEETVSPNKYKYTLQANDFVKLFLASDEEFDQLRETLIKDGSIDEHCIRRTEDFVLFRNLKILGTVHFLNQQKENCRKVECENMTFWNFDVYNCWLKASEEYPVFLFNNCTIKRLSIEVSYVSVISFRKNTILDHSWFQDAFLYIVEFQELTVRSVSFQKSFVDSFTLSKSTVKDFEIGSKSAIKSFSVKDGSEIGLLYCEEVVFWNFEVINSHLKTLVASKIVGELNLQGGSLNSSRILESIINDINVSFSADLNLNFSDSKINAIEFKNSGINPKSILSFNDTSIYAIIINKSSVLGNLYFRKINRLEDVTKWSNEMIVDFIGAISSDMTFREEASKIHESIFSEIEKEFIQTCDNIKRLHPDPVIQIAHSSLGKTEFTDFPLGDYRFEFRSSKVSECFVSGGSLPANNVHIVGAESGSKEEFEQKASFYNQFKKIFDAQGDIYHATQFQAKWAEEQRNALRLRHKEELIGNGFSDKGMFEWFLAFFRPNSQSIHKAWQWIINKKIMRRIGLSVNTTSNDLFTLWLNRLSNLHGESYLRALAFIALSALAFYLIHLCAIGRLYWGGEFDPNLLGYYFEYWNPAHKINFIAGDEKINGWAVAFDFVGRVFVSYGIYQFIAAFRKHTKKQ